LIAVLTRRSFNTDATRRSTQSLEPMSISTLSSDIPARMWWANQRLRFNLILLAAAPASLACLLAVAVAFESRLSCLEITLFTVFFGAIFFGLGLAAANVFYCLGLFVEWLVRPRRAMVLRKRLFAAGTLFSVVLIFSPVLVILTVAFTGAASSTSCRDSGL
jgi:hypothetical protein